MAVNLHGLANTGSTSQVDNSNVAKTTNPKNLPFVAKKPRAEDTTNFTSDTTSVKSLTQTALETSPSRQVRVESLKQAVSSAQYKLDADKIAASLADADV